MDQTPANQPPAVDPLVASMDTPPKRGGGLLVPILIIILVAVLAGAGTWWYMNYQANKQKQANEATINELTQKVSDLQKELDELKAAEVSNASSVKTFTATTTPVVTYTYPANLLETVYVAGKTLLLADNQADYQKNQACLGKSECLQPAFGITVENLPLANQPPEQRTYQAFIAQQTKAGEGEQVVSNTTTKISGKEANIIVREKSTQQQFVTTIYINNGSSVVVANATADKKSYMDLFKNKIMPSLTIK